ncbi:MAG: hypothetical protein PHH04_03165 [Thomasclavelia sp.]|jgi:hypothetical protein|nr:hypothetical protein [Thomasclavelia sp.]
MVTENKQIKDENPEKEDIFKFCLYLNDLNRLYFRYKNDYKKSYTIFDSIQDLIIDFAQISINKDYSPEIMNEVFKIKQMIIPNPSMNYNVGDIESSDLRYCALSLSSVQDVSTKYITLTNCYNYENQEVIVDIDKLKSNITYAKKIFSALLKGGMNLGYFRGANCMAMLVMKYLATNKEDRLLVAMSGTSDNLKKGGTNKHIKAFKDFLEDYSALPNFTLCPRDKEMKSNNVRYKHRGSNSIKLKFFDDEYYLDGTGNTQYNDNKKTQCTRLHYRCCERKIESYFMNKIFGKPEMELVESIKLLITYAPCTDCALTISEWKKALFGKYNIELEVENARKYTEKCPHCDKCRLL